MSDRDRVTELFDSLGIGWQPLAEVGDYYVTGQESPGSIYLVTGKSKIDGYNGFFARFEFDDDGAFQEVSVWE